LTCGSGHDTLSIESNPKEVTSMTRPITELSLKESLSLTQGCVLRRLAITH
jgi:hypothetical protein